MWKVCSTEVRALAPGEVSQDGGSVRGGSTGPATPLPGPVSPQRLSPDPRDDGALPQETEVPRRAVTPSVGLAGTALLGAPPALPSAGPRCPRRTHRHFAARKVLEAAGFSPSPPDAVLPPPPGGLHPPAASAPSPPAFIYLPSAGSRRRRGACRSW